MRRAVAQVMEVLAFAALVAGVYLLAGDGAALLAAGVLLAAVSLALEFAGGSR